MAETGNYVFPSKFANIMKGISQRTQYEASMMSMVFILLGLIFMGIYVPFFTDIGVWTKIGIVVNMIAGVVFLLSYLVTTFQQYQSYLMVTGVIEDTESYERRLSENG